MQFKIEVDELYPYYCESSFGVEVDVDAKTVRRWQKANDAFLLMQAEMQQVYRKKARPGMPGR